MIPATTNERGKRSGISPAAAAIIVVLIISASAVVIVEIQTSSNSNAIARTQTITTTVSQQSPAVNFIQSGGGQANSDQVTLESYNYRSIESGVVITVRDVGSTTVAISAVFFDGHSQLSVAPGCATGSPSISPAGTCTFTLVPAVAPASGTTHSVKIITTNGGTSVMTVVAGTSG